MATAATRQAITASNVQQLFPAVSLRLIGAELPPTHTTSTRNHDADLMGYDAEQIRLMDETCIVLDEDDNAIGTASKKDCHLMVNIDKGLLHRAFSTFLFHPSTKKLLLQQRAFEKITFPDMWTNTCCSHPLAHPSETGTGELLSNVEGAKRAAIRKLDHELGIPSRYVPIDAFKYLTRIQYKAPSDGKWGEHEIDYILFVEADPELKINENEVKDVRWVSMDELKQMFADAESKTGKDARTKYTPWFRLICETLLYPWWTALIEGDLSKYTGEKEIRRL